MKPQLSPNRWSCLPTALAIVLDLDVADVVKQIGHDGSDIIWPMEPEPRRRRGFHLEELQYAALFYGVVLVPFSPGFQWNPQRDPTKHLLEVNFTGKFESALARFDGLLVGEYHDTKNAHAVAWSSTEGQVHDSSGACSTSTLDAFKPDRFYAAVRLRG